MKQIIVIRRDLKMRQGKEIAQAGHAVLGAYRDALRRLGDDKVQIWEDNGQKKVTVKVNSEKALLALAEAAQEADLPHYLVRDHGRTEVAPDTPTALAIGPDESHRVSPITGNLELY